MYNSHYAIGRRRCLPHCRNEVEYHLGLGNKTLLHEVLGKKKLLWKLAACKNYSVIQFRAAARTYVWLNSSLQNRCSIINFPVFLTKYVECRNCAAVPKSLQISPVLSYGRTQSCNWKRKWNFIKNNFNITSFLVQFIWFHIYFLPYQKLSTKKIFM